MKMGRRLFRDRGIGHVSVQICSLFAPCRRLILIATKYLLFRGQDTSEDAPHRTCSTSHLISLLVGRKADFEVNFICRVLFEKHEILLV